MNRTDVLRDLLRALFDDAELGALLHDLSLPDAPKTAAGAAAALEAADRIDSRLFERLASLRPAHRDHIEGVWAFMLPEEAPTRVLRAIDL